MKPKYIPRGTEKGVGIGILIILVIIAIGIFWKQSRYDSSKFTIQVTPAETKVKETISESKTTPEKPVVPIGDYQPMGAKETFDEKTLSDKIDGKADLYLECGFKKMDSQRWVSGKDSQSWYEFFVYDMGNGRNAFTVYSNQRRPNVKDSPLAPFAYKTENSLFFVNGKYYVEIIASQANTKLMDAMNETGKGFLSQNPAKPVDLPELALFPTENLRKESLKLYLKNAFSYDKLEGVVVANYNMSSNTTMAFVSIRKNPEEARKMAEDYYKYLLSLGGDKVDTGESSVPDLKIVDLLGDYDMVFSVGNILAGVHQAKNLIAGKKVSESLYTKNKQGIK